jgi:hypothetical protein
MSKRKIWKKCRNIAVGFILLLLGACASSPTPSGNFSLLTSPDAELFQGGVSYLGSSEQPADYGKAKAAFSALLNTYPKSKWRELSEQLIHLIDETQACQAKNVLAEKTREDRERLLQDNEKLKQDIRQLNDKLKTETVRLSEENEQLKKDIQLLKNLEIQLEKRDKTLR